MTNLWLLKKFFLPYFPFSIFQVVPEIAKTALRLSWQRVKEDTKSSAFWEEYSALLPVIFQPITILQSEGSEMNQFLLEVTDGFLGGTKGGNKIIMI